ncbi:MAG: VWA domain-containing protein, partial [Bdellovibrionales bacterium]|nr:VWA domain-containing protein [Bdellovibrionales bacterium]
MAGFLSPHWYLTVLGLLVFGLVLVFLFQQKRRLLSIWSFELPSWIVTREVLALFFFSLLALAYARPYIGYEDISLPDHGDDVVIVFDVSRSMAAEDVKPNRLVFAKRKLLDLIDLFQSRGQGDKVSLVLFAGTSYTFCPLTSDYGVLKTFVEAIELSLISSEGSNLNIALGQALKVLQEVESRYGRIVVITDGEDNDFSLQNVLESLGKGEVPISVLAVGTESGAPIPAGGGRFVKDDEGEIVISRLQSGALQELARETGGTFQIAQLGDGDLERLARSVNPLRATGLLSSEAESTTVRSYKEIGPLLVALALFVHFISIFLRSGRGFVIFVACAFFGSLGNARAELPSISSLSPYEAKQLYENGNFDEAEAVFSREIREHPDDVRSLQAYASTLFQKKDYKNARKYFEQAAQAAKLSKDRFENLYNAGTSALFGQEPEEAVPLLEESLKVKSNDLAAQENLNLARKLLEQKQEQ